ncbi:MAG: phosphodiester glycosidase family protein [Candidatus Kapabacteria bacterium]|nr:phosphodiester glycosidase family protein [Candidatus Kapabacteria bacterium]
MAQRYHTKIILLLVTTTLMVLLSGYSPQTSTEYVEYIADIQHQALSMYWKNENGDILRTIQNLKEHVEQQNQQLLFAMNGGMFTQEYAPLGLYIQQQKVLTSLNTKSGFGNFYIKPNGVFWFSTNNKAEITPTANFTLTKNIRYATQSGPMLLINGIINTAFTNGSKNVNIRNGVGILPNNKVLFVMSKHEVNFYDFALYFKQRGCLQALYLDGFVSRTYAPSQKWIQTDGDFGVMIAVTKPKK